MATPACDGLQFRPRASGLFQPVRQTCRRRPCLQPAIYNDVWRGKLLRLGRRVVRLLFVRLRQTANDERRRRACPLGAVKSQPVHARSGVRGDCDGQRPLLFFGAQRYAGPIDPRLNGPGVKLSVSFDIDRLADLRRQGRSASVAEAPHGLFPRTLASTPAGPNGAAPNAVAVPNALGNAAPQPCPLRFRSTHQLLDRRGIADQVGRPAVGGVIDLAGIDAQLA